MRPVTQTISAVAASTPIALDYEPLSKITAAVTEPEGTTATFAIQVTMDQVFDSADPDYVAPGSARWFTVTGAPTDASGYVTIDGPWKAIRLNVTAIDTGTLVFQVGQATTPRA